jgi:hypothetical protein
MATSIDTRQSDFSEMDNSGISKRRRDDVDFITLTYLVNEALDPVTVREIESHKDPKASWRVYGLGTLWAGLWVLKRSRFAHIGLHVQRRLHPRPDRLPEGNKQPADCRYALEGPARIGHEPQHQFSHSMGAARYATVSLKNSVSFIPAPTTGLVKNFPRMPG